MVKISEHYFENKTNIIGALKYALRQRLLVKSPLTYDQYLHWYIHDITLTLDTVDRKTRTH